MEDIDDWESKDKIIFLVQISQELTVCARGTYEVGTERVLIPEELRAYNELQHRVTGALVGIVGGQVAMPPSTVLKMLRDFGVRRGREKLIEEAISQARRRVG